MKGKFAAQLDRLHQEMVKKSANLIRKMPPVVVRIMIAFDLFMILNPVWFWWFLYRQKGEIYSVRRLISEYINSMRYTVEYFLISRKHKTTGALNIDLFNPPRSEPVLSGGINLSADKPCGTCQSCCSTPWLPKEKQLTCPLLSENGCGVYLGIIWDYMNCGRYPFNRESIEVYQCPRYL